MHLEVLWLDFRQSLSGYSDFLVRFLEPSRPMTTAVTDGDINGQADPDQMYLFVFVVLFGTI